jgi:hypothetical protein
VVRGPEQAGVCPGGRVLRGLRLLLVILAVVFTAGFKNKSNRPSFIIQFSSKKYEVTPIYEGQEGVAGQEKV